MIGSLGGLENFFVNFAKIGGEIGKNACYTGVRSKGLGQKKIIKQRKWSAEKWQIVYKIY